MFPVEYTISLGFCTIFIRKHIKYGEELSLTAIKVAVITYQKSPYCCKIAFDWNRKINSFTVLHAIDWSTWFKLNTIIFAHIPFFSLFWVPFGHSIAHSIVERKLTTEILFVIRQKWIIEHSKFGFHFTWTATWSDKYETNRQLFQKSIYIRIENSSVNCIKEKSDEHKPINRKYTVCKKKVWPMILCMLRQSKLRKPQEFLLKCIE